MDAWKEEESEMKRNIFDPAKGDLATQVSRIMGRSPPPKPKPVTRPNKRPKPVKKYHEPYLTTEAEIFLEYFDAIDRFREAAEDAFFDAMTHLKENPELNPAWQEFIKGGGTSADDLYDCLLHGSKGRRQKEDVRTRTLPRTALRLVVNNKLKVTRLKSKRDPVDAA